ncbi:unnamed protein product [Lactuca virosa]|uniref:Retrotransposon Copia-like N-terminal domain-containing protein n=1 Tax=Lactuca virosa TaxID=75947 RepID=A0AAU9NVB9_9ASTR|nr:unnamed protein product [Lactuca virosa]
MRKGLKELDELYSQLDELDEGFQLSGFCMNSANVYSWETFCFVLKPNFSLLNICSKVVMDGSNYNDWMRNSKMALRFENKEYVLEKELKSLMRMKLLLKILLLQETLR